MAARDIPMTVERYNTTYSLLLLLYISQYSELINNRHHVFRPHCLQLCRYFLFMFYIQYLLAWRPLGVGGPEQVHVPKAVPGLCVSTLALALVKN